MPLLKQLSHVMEIPWVYALWQAPFLHAKFAPILKHNDLRQARRVLDVGCGPGTNTQFFEHADYVGIDINPSYIQGARAKYRRTFVEADVCTYTPSADQRYDFVLINSLLHHLDDVSADRILRAVSDAIVAGGHVHVIDLILPDQRGIPRYLTQNDRGDFPRPLAEWEALFARHYEAVICEPFDVGRGGVALWRMLYFKGRPKR